MENIIKTTSFPSYDFQLVQDGDEYYVRIVNTSRMNGNVGRTRYVTSSSSTVRTWKTLKGAEKAFAKMVEDRKTWR